MAIHRVVTDDNLRQMIRETIDLSFDGEAKKFARHLGISAAYLSLFLTGKRNAPRKILRYYKLQKHAVFKILREDSSDIRSGGR